MSFEPIELYQQAERLYNDGYSCSKIGRKLGINRKKVSAFLKYKGYSIIVIAGNHNKKYIEKKYTEAEKLFIEGRTLTSISQELKLSRSGFSNWLKKRGHIIKPARPKSKNEITEMNKKLKLAEIFFTEHKIITRAAKQANVGVYQLKNHLDANGYDTLPQTKYFVNENIFETIDKEEKAYWLGFLYADGYVNTSLKYELELALKLEDQGHIEKFKSFLNTNSKIKIKKVKLNGKIHYACRINIYNKKIVQDLFNLGCVENKSLILKFPTYEIVPKTLMRHFIRGYLDGDGSISPDIRRSGKEVTVSIIGTKEFLEELRKEIDLPKRALQQKENAYQLVYSGANIPLKILDYLYKDSKIYLDRKYNIYLEFCKNRLAFKKNQKEKKIIRNKKYVDALTLYQKVNSIRKVSILTGISRQTLTHILKQNNVQIQPSRPLTKAELIKKRSQEEEIVRLHNIGFSASKIRRKLGVRNYLVNEVLAKLNN